MLDDIYPRLLLEIIPDDLKLNSLGIQRLIAEHNSGSNANSVYGQLIKSIYADDPHSNIGMQFGKYLLPSSLCDYSRVLVSSPNLKTALEVLGRHNFIHGASYYPYISTRNGTASVSMTFPFKNNVPEAQKRYCSEAAFSYLVNTLRETISTDFKPKRVSFAFCQPTYANEYRPFFGDKVTFNAPLSLFEFDEQLLYENTQDPRYTVGIRAEF